MKSKSSNWGMSNFFQLRDEVWHDDLREYGVQYEQQDKMYRKTKTDYFNSRKEEFRKKIIEMLLDDRTKITAEIIKENGEQKEMYKVFRNDVYGFKIEGNTCYICIASKEIELFVDEKYTRRMKGKRLENLF